MSKTPAKKSPVKKAAAKKAPAKKAAPKPVDPAEAITSDDPDAYPTVELAGLETYSCTNEAIEGASVQTDFVGQQCVRILLDGEPVDPLPNTLTFSPHDAGSKWMEGKDAEGETVTKVLAIEHIVKRFTVVAPRL